MMTVMMIKVMMLMIMMINLLTNKKGSTIKKIKTYLMQVLNMRFTFL